MLLIAAEEAIRADGPGVSMDDIAHRAGVSKATMYDNFDGRADLTQALFDRYGQRLLAGYAESLGEALDPEAFVRGGVAVFVRHIDADREIYRFVARTVSDDALLHEVALPLAALTRSILTHQGKDAEGADALAHAALGALFTATAWWSQHRIPSRSVFERTLADFIWGGVVNAGLEPTSEPVDVAALVEIIARTTGSG